MKTPLKLVQNLKEGQPVFVIETNTLATVINRNIEPNGYITYKTDDGVRDCQNLVPINMEQTANNLIKILGIAPSVRKKFNMWFKF